MFTPEMISALAMVKADLVNNLPYVTGRMKSNTRMSILANGDVEFLIDVPYATFVNYGFRNHPGSLKLERDYMIVERSIKNSLRTIFQAKGAVISDE